MGDDRENVYDFIMSLNQEQISKMILLLDDDFKVFKRLMAEKLLKNE